MKKTPNKQKWKTMIIIIGVLFFISWFLAAVISAFSGEEKTFGNVALIPIKGTITTGSEDFFSGYTTSSSRIVDKIEQAENDNSIKAVIFEIDSGGGGPVASEEIARAIERLNKTTVAWIREMGASGAYWAAASTDRIFASKVSIVGSIGVLSSGLEFSRFLEEHNITHIRLVGGEYKDIGSPLKEMTYSEKQLLQKKIDLTHEYFLNDVARLRNLNESTKEEVGTAMIYIGMEAINFGLVDEIGSKADVVFYLEKKLNTTVNVKSYADKKSFLDVLEKLVSAQGFQMGRGMANFLNEKNNLMST